MMIFWTVLGILFGFLGAIAMKYFVYKHDTVFDWKSHLSILCGSFIGSVFVAVIWLGVSYVLQGHVMNYWLYYFSYVVPIYLITLSIASPLIQTLSRE
jgi:H+/Cl- antiporter ClcA